MIVCAGDSESFSFATPVGIGLINSAINLTNLIEKNRPNWLAFIGTAGVYGGANIGELYLCDRASNVEISSILGLSYTPISTTVSVRLPEFLLTKTNNTNKSKNTASLPIVNVNSSNFITTDTNAANELFKRGFMLENMEIYSIFSVADRFSLPCFGLLYATNFCNKNAHQDFLTNHAKAKETLSKKAAEIFDLKL